MASPRLRGMQVDPFDSISALKELFFELELGRLRVINSIGSDNGRD